MPIMQTCDIISYHAPGTCTKKPVLSKGMVYTIQANYHLLYLAASVEVRSIIMPLCTANWKPNSQHFPN